MTGNKTDHTIDRAIEVLTGIATNREVIKQELAKLPDDDPQINKTAVEYEIQLLRIVFTGWALSYFMADHPSKDELAEAFWFSMHAFAGKISAMASAGTDGKTIDYFSAIRERIQCYIEVMSTNMDTVDPSIVVGTLFAQLCGNAEARPIADAGRLVFFNTLSTVKLYLDTVEIEQPS